MNIINTISRALTFVLILTIPQLGWTQAFPDYGPAFPQDQVTTIDIVIDPDSMLDMILNLESEHYYPASFTYTSSSLVEIVDSIGIQLRGNSSLSAFKKSFKISFDAFDDGNKWQSMKKINLLAQHNDPSMLRSKLCFDMYRYFGIPCARTSYTKVNINGEYAGLYLNVEQIDDQFAEAFFDGEGDGNLYKCTYPADLNYISENPDDYKFEDWGIRPYDLKTNEWKDDYNDLAQLISVLNNVPVNDLHCELSNVMNIESFLKTSAIDILLGNWDSHIYNKNNFYLYHNQQTGLMEYIPYDLDNTFGMDWINIDWTERNIYTWSPNGEQRPAYTRLMNDPVYRDRFSYYIETMIAEYFNESNITTRAEYWQNLIQPWIYTDPYYSLDYGFTTSDFDDAILNAWGNHIDYGIVPYVTARKNSAISQLENYENQGAIVHWVAPKRIEGDMLIESLITGPQAENCTLLLSVDGTNYTEIQLTDLNGILQTENDHIYSYYDEVWPMGTDQMYYQVRLPDNSLFPCEPAFFYTTPLQTGLYLNEVMAVNNTTIHDEENVYEDWLEIYNSTSSVINLEGYFVSDDTINWNKFPLPNFNLQPHAFALIWFDDDVTHGMWHGTFKLGSGENVILTKMTDGVSRTCQEMTGIPFLADISLELTTDGGSISASENNPTPGYSNLDSAIDESVGFMISSYPNPADGLIIFSRPVGHACLIDVNGKIVVETFQSSGLNTSSVTNGTYFLKLDSIIVKQIILHK